MSAPVASCTCGLRFDTHLELLRHLENRESGGLLGHRDRVELIDWREGL